MKSQLILLKVVFTSYFHVILLGNDSQSIDARSRVNTVKTSSNEANVHSDAKEMFDTLAIHSVIIYMLQIRISKFLISLP